MGGEGGERGDGVLGCEKPLAWLGGRVLGEGERRGGMGGVVLVVVVKWFIMRGV